jgi:hypothetical protein
MLAPMFSLSELSDGLADHIRYQTKHGSAAKAEALTHIRDQLSVYRFNHGGDE